tara:strand:+ start:6078 stop:6482 length:405 start_codon:yes stop_codon:yes gene_type:complete
MLYAIGILCLGLSLISARNSYYPLKWLTSFAWWGLLVYWLDADLAVDGSPTDVIIMLVIIMAALLFMLWGLAGRKGNLDVEERYSSSGKLLERTVKSITKKEPRRNSSMMNESSLEHRERLRKSLGRGKSSKKR